MTELLKVNKEEWKAELEAVKNDHYSKFGDKLPAELTKQLEELMNRLG